MEGGVGETCVLPPVRRIPAGVNLRQRSAFSFDLDLCASFALLVSKGTGAG